MFFWRWCLVFDVCCKGMRCGDLICEVVMLAFGAWGLGFGIWVFLCVGG